MSLINLNRAFNKRWPNFMDSFFEDSILPVPNTYNVPATNVSEQDATYTITVAAPGLSKEDFSVEVEKNVLTISSEKEKSAETKEDQFTRKEYSYESFSRSFVLPEDVLSDDIEANYKNGELILTVPKKEVTISKAKLIEVA